MADASIEATPKSHKKISRKLCSVEGCGKPFQARGFCVFHYNEFHKSSKFTRTPRNVGTPEERFHRSYQIDPVSGCWVWTETKNDKGYGMFYLPGGRKQRAHRFSYELYRCSIPDELLVLHQCDNPQCVNPIHLFLGTARDNALDMSAKGRHPSQTNRGGSDLTWAKVTGMRVLYARERYSVEKVAWLYGLNSETVRPILKGKAWLSWAA